MDVGLCSKRVTPGSDPPEKNPQNRGKERITTTQKGSITSVQAWSWGLPNPGSQCGSNNRKTHFYEGSPIFNQNDYGIPCYSV